MKRSRPAPARPPLYTPEQRIRRDASRWTLVQGVLAPAQFLIFAVSLALVLRFLATGENEGAAVASVLLKTLALYTIMVTGALWEHDVYGRYLFAPAFWWEDAVSMVVIALHTLYVLLWVLDIGGAGVQMSVALAAYAVYVVNAAQFVWKLRQARLGAAADAERERPALSADGVIATDPAFRPTPERRRRPADRRAPAFARPAS